YVEGAAQLGVARGFRHDGSAAEGLDELRIRYEACRAPAFEACEGATYSGVEVEQLLFAFLAAHAHAIRRIETEDARIHVACGRQHARNVFRSQRPYILLRDDDRVFVRRAGESGGPEVPNHGGNSSGVHVERENTRHCTWEQVRSLNRQIVER